jgi:hypothetical protein
MRGGARQGSGRKKGIGVTTIIEKYVYKFVTELLNEEVIRRKAIDQIEISFKEKKEYIYIIKNNDLYKIGYTSNFEKRLKNYKTHLGFVDIVLLYETNNAFKIESDLHQFYYNHSLKNKEWYKFSDLELINVIKNITKKVYNV